MKSLTTRKPALTVLLCFAFLFLTACDALLKPVADFFINRAHQKVGVQVQIEPSCLYTFEMLARFTDSLKNNSIDRIKNLEVDDIFFKPLTSEKLLGAISSHFPDYAPELN